MFRVYSDANGDPADHSLSNVPLNPKRHLTVNMGGVKEDDFAMILGYPGRTNRWLPAGGIDQNVKYAYPAWVEASKLNMDVMKKYMDKNDDTRLDYESKYAGIANYWKNRQGMIDALTKAKTAKLKGKNEAKFNKWANKKENVAKYGKVVETINRYYSKTNEKARHDNYLMQIFRGSSFATISRSLGRELENYAKATPEEQSKQKNDLLARIDEFYNEISMEVEKDLLASQFELYTTKAGYKIAPILLEIGNKSNNDFTNYVNSTFENSLFGSIDKIKAFIESPKDGVITKDPLYQLSSELLLHYNSRSEELTKLQADFTKSFRLLVAGMRESKLSTVLYPDANSTLRLTYGKVSALPADKRNDAMVNYYTTLDGTIKKYKPKDEEFDLPQRLMELHKTKDYGPYVDQAGHLPVNFLTDNDITGGNSGSPVLNGKGELIGLAFDGNIEAMAGDVIFDTKLQKTINVDIRYVLFIIDKFAGAKHIVDEMTIVK
jgi:hypothetical protein